MKCYSERVDGRRRGEPKKEKKMAEEEESRRGGKGGDGSSNEVVKRRRGRPPGSKNKSQAPVVITREHTDSSPTMRPHVLEILTGHDIAAALAAFSSRCTLGLCVLAAAGPITNITLRQLPFPVEGSPSAAAVVMFGGRFDILSISDTLFSPSLLAAVAAGIGGGFSMSLAGQRRVLGVAGEAAWEHGGGDGGGASRGSRTVVVVAAVFVEHTFNRLPVVVGDGSDGAIGFSVVLFYSPLEG